MPLSYTIIRSPIDGRTGNLAVKAGNLVTANSTELMTIAQMQPVYVTFSVPAVHLPTIKQPHGRKAADGHRDAAGRRRAAGPRRPHLRRQRVDMTTDTIKLKATFDNADRGCGRASSRASACASRRCRTPSVVPGQAVQTGQDGQFVFVVKPDSTVEQRAGHDRRSASNEDVVIDKGLKPGETVVTEGQLRLEPGTRVQTGTTGEAVGGAAAAARRTRRRAGRRRAGRPGGDKRGGRSMERT